jgi:hypothetical protein
MRLGPVPRPPGEFEGPGSFYVPRRQAGALFTENPLTGVPGSSLFTEARKAHKSVSSPSCVCIVFAVDMKRWKSMQESG